MLDETGPILGLTLLVAAIVAGISPNAAAIVFIVGMAAVLYLVCMRFF